MPDLDGSVVLISGGSSGIGLATVARLSAAGARTVVVDVQPPPEGIGDVFLDVDAGDAGAWEAAVRLVEDKLGGLDAVHLNAGLALNAGMGRDVADPVRVALDDYRRVMRVNVDGVFLGLRAALPALRRRGHAAVVVTASLAGLAPFPVDPVYAATKHAVVGLVRSLAPVLEDDAITLNAVCPGIVETPMIGDAATRLRDAGFPLLSPDDVAAAVVHAMTCGRTGVCWAVQPGREPLDFRFTRVPGPRTPGAEGMAPPLDALVRPQPGG